MQILNSTTQVLRVVTDVAADVDVVASYVDRNGTTFTPGNNGGISITTAATTTIVPAPAASTERNIKGVSIRNRDTTDTVTATVQFYDGVNAFELISEALAPGEEIIFDSLGNWSIPGRLPRVTRTVIPGILGLTQDVSIGGYVTNIGYYDTPPNVVSLFVECLGAGGYGGQATNAATNGAAGGGGGSGQYTSLAIASVAPRYQYALDGYDGAFGNNATYFGITAWGGFNGEPSAWVLAAASGGDGAADTVGTIHIGGIPGVSYCGPAGFGFCLAAAQATSGRGGSGPYGMGGRSIRNATSVGEFATGFGAGGGGACIISGQANRPLAGGQPSAGLIVVTEYYK